MKKLLTSTAVLAAALFASSASHAACNEWGTVNYMSKASTGILAIIGGTACWVQVTGTNATTVAAVLATANANNKQAIVSSNGDVSIEYQ